MTSRLHIPLPYHHHAVSATFSLTSAVTHTRASAWRPRRSHRLETPSKKLKQKKRFGWKKFTFGARLLLTLVWMFVPKDSEKRTVLTSGSGEFVLGARRTKGRREKQLKVSAILCLFTRSLGFRFGGFMRGPVGATTMLERALGQSIRMCASDPFKNVPTAPPS
ncbi:hypothetical protein DFH09DRAFT_1321818 [Mycena vulgaris]|nr:hypothetical protein DFH09DRAFT_1321818 [Mycena vulgaris]